MVVRDVPFAQLPSDLARRNTIFMRNEEEFARGMPALVVTLATDLAWVREHTRRQGLALSWLRDNRTNARLLGGEALTAAERWLASQPSSAHFRQRYSVNLLMPHGMHSSEDREELQRARCR